LDFYYREILKFLKKDPVPDKVHVLFELKKNVENQFVKAGTLLKAGKDKQGTELFYALAQDIVVNTATIDSLRSVFVDNNNSVHIAPIANSGDGLGGDLEKDEPKWQPFGSETLPQAELGFALASPVLRLQEGNRTITVNLTLTGLSGTAFTNTFIVFLTGEKGWIGPKYAELEVTEISGNRYDLEYSISLTAEDEPIVHYHPDIHGNTFETAAPMMQVLLNNEHADNGYGHLKNAVLRHAKITVTVDGIQSLTLENDLGKLDPSKPFMPFGPQPVAGSSFYVEYEEALQKKLDTFSLNIEWQNVPDGSLANYYHDYETDVASNSHFTAKLLTKDTSEDVLLFSNADARSPVTISKTRTFLLSAPLVAALDYKIYKLAQQRNTWAGNMLNQMHLTSDLGAASAQNIKSKSQAPYTPPGERRNVIALQLKRSFLHKEYRELYTKKIVEFTTAPPPTAEDESPPALVLPKEAYTPVIQSLTLSYTATAATLNLASSTEDDFLNDEVELFHITAFGQKREHGFQKRQLDFVDDKNVYLLPQYRNEGELYIGVARLKPLQNLSVLFQVAEGSANPEKEPVDVHWSILSDNHWKLLDDTDVLSDTTSGLLTSGIVTFSIPKEATTTNTILPAGTHWLKAEVKTDTDTVCQLLDVKANAVLAQFKDRQNDPEHLRTPLVAGTISKFVESIGGIKGITQPYASFGGHMAEDDHSFYTRVSERLRHKNRAVNLWDYERIVLQNFPSVYKVKCLNHTSPTTGSAPGHVTLIVIPDLKNKNAVNPLQPKVDLNTLDEIDTLLKQQHVGYFIQMHVENPSYEEITVDFNVSFHSGDFVYYKGVLDQDIKRFLSPWAYDEGQDIVFGGQIHKSVILNFIEQRPYVDYVTNFKMYHLTGDRDVEIAVASNPKAILVSGTEHTIKSV
jgi:hypothetical protein